MSARKQPRSSPLEAAARRRAAIKPLYRRAFDEFGTRALWNLRRFDDPRLDDALAAARQLRIEGNLAARRLAEEIEKLARAGPRLSR